MLYKSSSIIHVVIDWLKSLKQIFIDVSYHIPVASKTEPSELAWLQVYDMTH